MPICYADHTNLHLVKLLGTFLLLGTIRLLKPVSQSMFRSFLKFDHTSPWTTCKIYWRQKGHLSMGWNANEGQLPHSKESFLSWREFFSQFLFHLLERLRSCWETHQLHSANCDYLFLEKDCWAADFVSRKVLVLKLLDYESVILNASWKISIKPGLLKLQNRITKCQHEPFRIANVFPLILM